MEEAYFWYRLFMTRGTGPKKLARTARMLDEYRGNPNAIPADASELDEKHPQPAALLGEKLGSGDTEDLYSSYEELTNESVAIIHPGLPVYPAGLLDDAEKYGISPVLFVKGRMALLQAEGVAIAGSRNVSEEGAEIARTVAAELAGRGMNVVSGYAKGVDTLAHLGALEAGGTTTAVLAQGIRTIPVRGDFGDADWEHRVLVVSQFEPDAIWTSYRAMMRNRLICALSRAVLVIESGPERDSRGRMSGTFNTGKAALEMNKPLFVISPASSEGSRIGSVELIRCGGIEVEPEKACGEILERLGALKGKGESSKPSGPQSQMTLFDK
jgi:DNA processing protein